MTEQEFLDHHRLARNPFADEDAQTDAVFKDGCIAESRHPAWSKVYGDPLQPATAIVLGSKGAGKTAMRLQMTRSVQEHNLQNRDRRVFFVQYDDFNKYLGPLQQSLSSLVRSNPDKVLAALQVSDHMDAILSEATTTLVDQILKPSEASVVEGLGIEKEALEKLDSSQRRDLLILAACFDQSRYSSFSERMKLLRRSLKFSNWQTWSWILCGVTGSILSFVFAAILYRSEISVQWLLITFLVGTTLSWIPYAARYLGHFWKARLVARSVRIARRDVRTLCRSLMQIPSRELAGQPIPTTRGSDQRYSMIDKLQSILRTLGFHGVVVFVDRVDEPEIINGRAERMRALVWPMLDNKLLKHPGLGIKLLLPNELQYFLDRETREFNERARLDKQNFIGNFDWTGEALFDVSVSRMKACSSGNRMSPLELLDERITETRLLAAMQALRTPRNLFRFLYRLISEHCKSHRSSEPSYKISSETFESTLAVFQNELQRSVATP
jgi:hypothetical protein